MSVAEEALLETRLDETSAAVESAIARVSEVVVGKEHVIRLAMACLLARGHLLIEDLPGVGKTTLSQALGAALGWKRDVSSSPVTCCPLMYWVCPFLIAIVVNFNSTLGQFSRNSYSRTKLIEQRPRRRVPCSKPWKSVK